MKDKWLRKHNAREFGRCEQRKAAVYVMIFAGLYALAGWLRSPAGCARRLAASLKTSMDFQQFRELFWSFPAVEKGTAYGTPIFRIKKKMLARLFENSGDTVVIKVELPLRSTFLDGEACFITPHYEA